jgi:hypothetical protein
MRSARNVAIDETANISRLKQGHRDMNYLVLVAETQAGRYRQTRMSRNSSLEQI